MADSPHRRVMDRITNMADIEQMILNEDDPKQRAFLIVLNSINNSLIANTDTIRDVSEKLENHLTNFEEYTKTEEAMLNKGRGAWKVITWVISVVQIIGLGIWTDVRGDLQNISETAAEAKIKLIQMDSRISTLEKAK